MSEMVERVARAMYERIYARPLPTPGGGADTPIRGLEWDNPKHIDPFLRDRAREDAKVAISTMLDIWRDVTEEALRVFLTPPQHTYADAALFDRPIGPRAADKFARLLAPGGHHD